MEPLKLPVLFESEKQFRLLVNECGRLPSPLGPVKHLLAHYLYARLWVDLALEARATDRVGFLSEAGARLYLERLSGDWGTSLPETATTDWLDLLVRATVLERIEGGYECPAFNIGDLNAQCAGSYLKREQKAANHSAFNRGKQQREHESQWLAMTLGTYHGRDGQVLTPDQVARAVNVVKSFDNVLRLAPRAMTGNHWPPGLVADAAEVEQKYGEVLDKVYHFILDNRNSPQVPKTTEQCLAMFGGLLKSVFGGRANPGSKGAEEAPRDSEGELKLG
jgi:hypothetical protein